MTGIVKTAISVGIFAICIVAVEVCLKLFAPVPDPFQSSKYETKPNQYIKSEFPRDFHFATEPEEGLPGVNPPNVFSTNKLGFRGDDLSIPKPADEFRIFMIGGSSTECLYLDDSEAINRTLQEELSSRGPKGLSVKVYGAGKSGDASDDHISMLVHRIVHLEPDMIIVFAGINDLSRSIYNYDYLHYAREGPETKLPIATLLATEFQVPRRIFYALSRISPDDDAVLTQIASRSSYKEKVRIRKSSPVSNEPPRVDLTSYGANLRSIVGVAQKNAVRLVFMTQQTTWNSAVDTNVKKWQWMLYRGGVTYREDHMDAAMESLNDQMRLLASENTVPLYDLSRSMPKSLEFFYDDVHFNENGARAAAIGLANLIFEKNLIGPRD